MFIDVFALEIVDPKIGFTLNGRKLLEMPSSCPYCGAANQRFSVACFRFPDDPYNLESIFYCNHCAKFFRVSYTQEIDSQSFSIAYVYDDVHLEYFSESIKNLSPGFIQCFTEAEQAEKAGFRSIVGPGYRKALEFLIKDFAVTNDPQNQDKIYSMNLSQAITQYIDHPKIQSLSKGAAWLGNDHTHLVPKHADYDLSDLKRFIIATAKYIDLELTVEEADGLLQSKK